MYIYICTSVIVPSLLCFYNFINIVNSFFVWILISFNIFNFISFIILNVFVILLFLKIVSSLLLFISLFI